MTDWVGRTVRSTRGSRQEAEALAVVFPQSLFLTPERPFYYGGRKSGRIVSGRK